ncbi:RidA family protein [Streptomyces sp. NBC_01803]|uniref:RidA family protein n=1 Tax=Streptomyces sp. NBC_01803 TaxID=2975946 RepID=UPI002DDAFCC4|nr:RidA family protein [Streptomyces sp. NBC_01803]WSA47421.1 RidA family protein [Streptomyces sp. NBC_01803]
MSSQPPGETVSARLSRLGYALPEQASGKERYVPYRRDGSTIHISGQLPYVDGALPAQGHLGRDVDIPQAQESARLAALNVLGVAASAAGGLEHVRLVQMLVFVASTPDFGDQSRVADAASSFLLKVLGENGEHARTAIGVAALPRNSPIEIQMICTVA